MGGTNLLNADGSASIATALMMSHHAFRRDLACFAVALETMARGDTSRTDALREEWHNFRNALHGHHESEDSRMFPYIRAEHASLAPVIERLMADHRKIDPLLERGDRAFAGLPRTEEAAAVVAEIRALLDAHLATEEAEVVPFLRSGKQFPPPGNDAEAELYAQGFAWSSHGIAPEVLERVYAMLPEVLTSRIAEARAAYEARCARVWGSAKAGASRTSVPSG
jgi:hypothetical protein